MPDGGFSVGNYVEQLSSYCDQHNLQEVHLFGYSMGGYVALCFACQQPARVASILTLATKFDWTVEGAAKESKLLNPTVIEDKVPKYAAQLAAWHGEHKWRQLLPAVANMMLALGKDPWLSEPVLSALNIPVQLMVGDNDAMVTIAETQAACSAIPKARMAVLPATKHPIDALRSELLLQLMADFWMF